MPRKDLVTIRRGTLAQWATAEAAGAVLLAGERGYITDLNLDVVGDGVTKVASLPGVGGNTYVGLSTTGSELDRVSLAGAPALNWYTNARYGFFAHLVYAAGTFAYSSREYTSPPASPENWTSGYDQTSALMAPSINW